MDFPYPVGKETNVSLPDAKETMASTCLSFKEGMPNDAAVATTVSFNVSM